MPAFLPIPVLSSQSHRVLGFRRRESFFRAKPDCTLTPPRLLTIPALSVSFRRYPVSNHRKRQPLARFMPYEKPVRRRHKTTASGDAGGRRFMPVSSCIYFMLPDESMVMPPGPWFFLSSFSLRVCIAFWRQSSAAATSALRAASSPKSTSALRR